MVKSIDSQINIGKINIPTASHDDLNLLAWDRLIEKRENGRENTYYVEDVTDLRANL